MIGNEPLVKVLKLSLQTAYIKGHKPISILLIAKAESGKTESIMKESITLLKKQKIAYMTDITAYSITRELLPKIQNKEIRHIVIPDLLNAIQKHKATRMSFVNFMKSLVEEGIVSISSYAVTFKSAIPVQCGLISAITIDNFESVKREWSNIGFLSRMIPFSYKYSINKITRIIESIVKEMKEDNKNNGLKIRIKDKEIKGKPALFKRLEILAMELGRNTKSYGFRPMKQLIALSKANAYIEGRSEVHAKDIEEILRLGNWINYDFNAL